MNYKQRLEEIELILNAGSVMSIADMAHWFWLKTEEWSAGKRELGEHGGYVVPGRKQLFSTFITPEDWEWMDANVERFMEAVEFHQRTRGR